MSVVVGVDGSAACRTAIRLAAQEARYRQAQLIAIMTYGRERVLGAPASQPVATLTTVDEERSAAESSLRDAVIDALGHQADHVELRVMTGTAGRQLVEAAREISAIIVGGHDDREAYSVVGGGVHRVVLLSHAWSLRNLP